MDIDPSTPWQKGLVESGDFAVKAPSSPLEAGSGSDAGSPKVH